MTITPSILIAVVALLIAAGLGVKLPFMDEIRAAIRVTIPYAPILVGIFLLKGLADKAAALAEKILRVVGAILMGLVFLFLIAPIMIADTFLLGDFAQWMWKHEVGPLVLVILSCIALSILYVAEGKLTYEASRKYLTVMVIIGVGSILWGYASSSWTNTHRVGFKIVDKVISSEPAASIRVKGGDYLKVTAFGRTTGWKGKIYTPQGDLEDLTIEPWFGEERPRGEMWLRVHLRGGEVVAFPLENIQSGPHKSPFDWGSLAGGYYIRGDARVPEGADGRLSVGFYGLYPDTGTMKVTIQLNPHRSFVGRMMGLRDYVGVLGMLALGMGIVAALGLGMKLMPAGGMRVVVIVALAVAGYFFFLATVGAARRATGVDAFRSLERLTGFRAPGGGGAPTAGGSGYEVIARVAPGRQENLARHVPAGARASISTNEGRVWLTRGKGGKQELIEGQKALEWKDPMILTGDGEVSIWVRPRR